MGGLFSSHKKDKHHAKKQPPRGTVTATDRAILDLKNARDNLSRYRIKLNDDEKKLLVRAKALQISGQTNMAIKLMQLRRHKLKDAQNVEEQLLNVLKMVETIQTAQNEQEVLQALATGKNALAALHKEMSVDDVLQLMEEVQEQNEIENEINSILREGVSLSATDEMQIEKELEEMMREESQKVAEKDEEEQEVMEEAEEEEVVDELPEVPTTKLPDLPEPSPKEKVSEPAKKVAVPS